jgi:hypothetical protein
MAGIRMFTWIPMGQKCLLTYKLFDAMLNDLLVHTEKNFSYMVNAGVKKAYCQILTDSIYFGSSAKKQSPHSRSTFSIR